MNRAFALAVAALVPMVAAGFRLEDHSPPGSARSMVGKALWVIGLLGACLVSAAVMVTGVLFLTGVIR